MRNVLRALLKSRKDWVGGITVVVTALVLKFVAPALSLTDDQTTLLAVAIVGIGVTIIASIAYEDAALKGNESARAAQKREEPK